MKKILAVVLGILILTGGLIGCKPKDEPNPHEGLYGTYKMVSLDNGGIEIEGNGWYKEPASLPCNNLPNDMPQEDKDNINNTVIGILTKVGDTMTITKDKVKFNDGSMKLELDYEFYLNNSIYFDREITDSFGFPFYSIEIQEFDNPTIYQLVTSYSLFISYKPRAEWKPNCSMNFYFLKVN